MSNETTTTVSDPIAEFVTMFSCSETAYDLGTHMTCMETDAYANLMMGTGHMRAAEAVTAGHLESENWACEGLDEGQHIEIERPDN
ncbi:hypothetical protein WC1_61 [Rhodococcus phage WC1]|uniref:Uncharacterized protein n=4 Tax=Rerduovirus TaxID=1982375 RepID=G9FHV4_9CAUD|nr:hypothetical protein RoPhRER2_gp54 [Rhodococcus phage RER2]YP_009189714.1 hypothetical protein AU091_gp12 [Rhodococcus phage CosmicSans]YP_009834101.1 hypothetical protein HWB24_gp11 [Rhodococcus phage Hiro]ALA46264.1 hypothetical protein PBI_RHODALYSA_61 [Rhodococcus phage Rhodalysa]ALN97105.1 hypothetical protein SEA_TWAMP_61 [Rhodococcus phage TWAMP]ALO80659.1 hypothetical protein SEA_LILLIE_61 [Rhodococcus phage Lillie]AOT23627.1 hypothetical protein SEA_HARLEQUIN_61 [Rhodococcus phage